MIKHIVMWNFHDNAEGKTKAENIAIVKQQLEALPKVIPQLKFIEVNANVNPDGFDAVLYSEFETLEDLETYQNHPEHKKIAEYVKKVRTERVVGDYKV